MVIKRFFLSSLLVGTAFCFFQAKAMGHYEAVGKEIEGIECELTELEKGLNKATKSGEDPEEFKALHAEKVAALRKRFTALEEKGVESLVALREEATVWDEVFRKLEEILEEKRLEDQRGRLLLEGQHGN